MIPFPTSLLHTATNAQDTNSTYDGQFACQAVCQFVYKNATHALRRREIQTDRKEFIQSGFKGPKIGGDVTFQGAVGAGYQSG
ncbi:MAG: hypothetical protein NT069_32835 [Planctomycetota bacterium]|nr:hypothetical protein [Planctomycetota bacterium]